MERDFNILGHTVQVRPLSNTSPSELDGMGRERIREATERLLKYQSGKSSLEKRVIGNEEWYRGRHWGQVKNNALLPGQDKNGLAGNSHPSSAWLFNSLANKHADVMDNYPEPAVLPREKGDEQDAKSLSAILPVVIERNNFEAVYSDAWWDKLKHGTAAYGVFWDNSAENGLGDIAIRQIDMLNIYWQPGVSDVQDSPHLYILGLVDNETLEAQYPQLKGKLGGRSITVPTYLHDDSIDDTEKSVVVDWYYKVRRGGRTLLHYCKFCGEEVLFASEGQPEYAEGWYEHGMYPVVLDVLFPIKESPAGFGYVDIMRDPQLYIDSLDEVILMNARFSALPRWFIRDNPGLSKEQFLDWREPFVDVAVSVNEDNMRQIKVDALDSFIIDHLQYKVNELKETSGNRDFNQGGSTSGVTAAAAISALQEAGNKLSRDMIKGAYRSFIKLNQLVIELIRQFYDETRYFRIQGEDAAIQYVEFNNSGIKPRSQTMPGGGETTRKPIFDINVKAQKSNPFSRMTQNEMAKELYSMGFFDPQRAEQVMTALEMMEFEGKPKVIERVQQGDTLLNLLQQQQQRIEQMAQAINMLQGREIMPSGGGRAQRGGQQPAPAARSSGRKSMENEGDAAQRNSTAYADALARRSVPSVEG